MREAIQPRAQLRACNQGSLYGTRKLKHSCCLLTALFLFVFVMLMSMCVSFVAQPGMIGYVTDLRLIYSMPWDVA